MVGRGPLCGARRRAQPPMLPGGPCASGRSNACSTSCVKASLLQMHNMVMGSTRRGLLQGKVVGQGTWCGSKETFTLLMLPGGPCACCTPNANSYSCVKASLLKWQDKSSGGIRDVVWANQGGGVWVGQGNVGHGHGSRQQKVFPAASRAMKRGMVACCAQLAVHHHHAVVTLRHLRGPANTMRAQGPNPCPPKAPPPS
jgi:hypothetical protein